MTASNMMAIEINTCSGVDVSGESCPHLATERRNSLKGHFMGLESERVQGKKNDIPMIAVVGKCYSCVVVVKIICAIFVWELEALTTVVESR